MSKRDRRASIKWVHFELCELANGARTAWKQDVPSNRRQGFWYQSNSYEHALLELTRRMMRYRTRGSGVPGMSLPLELFVLEWLRYIEIVTALGRKYPKVAKYWKDNQPRIDTLDAAVRLLQS